MFLLKGVISPYDGSFDLGVFSKLELAIEARKKHHERSISSYESYEIYEFKVDEPVENETNHQPVDVFVPGKTKIQNYKRR
jgi:hypothetical protein